MGTLLRSALLIAGTKALGQEVPGLAFYESVERDLAFGIMRSYFHHGYPKGAHCCVQCTLAVYPALEARTIRYFDCTGLSAHQSTGWSGNASGDSPAQPIRQWSVGPSAAPQD